MPQPIIHPPSDWMKICIVDPGTARSGLVCLGVPGPPSGCLPEDYQPTHVHAYACRMLYNEPAEGMAKAIQELTGSFMFETFIIDKKAGMQTPMGFNWTVREQYARELAKLGVRCKRMGSDFEYSSDDVEGRELLLKAWMRGDDPILKIHPDTMFLLVRQMSDFYRSKQDWTKREKSTKKELELVHCFDAATEVLTNRGWKLFSQLSSERLATVNLLTDQLEFQAPSRIIARQHNGAMIAIGGNSRQKVDVLVTPEHRMVIYELKASTPKVVLADRLKYWHRLKLFCKWKGSDRTVFELPAVNGHKHWSGIGATPLDAGHFAEFMGWFLAEGSTDSHPKCPGSGYRVVISQNSGRKKELLRELLANLPWKWQDIKTGFQASSKQLWTYLRQFGKAPDKFIPQWILDSPPNIIGRFMTGAVLGDGTMRVGGSRSYTTVSRRLADGIQECFIKLGRSASIRVNKAIPYNIHGRSGTNTRPQFQVVEWLHPHAQLGRRNQPVIRKTRYSGMVYCATVPNGTLIVRRNGKPVIAGNCVEYGAAWFNGRIFWSAPEPVKREAIVDDGVAITKMFVGANWNLRKYEQAREKRKNRIV